MKRFLGWLFMVLLFTSVVVGGAIGFFYWQAGESQLPDAQATLADQTLGSPAGYDWQVPVLGGVLWRPLRRSPGLAQTALAQPITTPSPRLALPEGASEGASSLTIKNEAGATVFEGTAAQFKQFAFQQNGSYTLTLKAGRSKGGQPPAKPAGYYQYQCRFQVQVQPQLHLSADKAAQGQAVAVYLGGVLSAEATAPTAQCQLGPVWFQQLGSGWLGYLPVTYNASSGSYPITVEFNGQTYTAALTVHGQEWPQAPASGGGSGPANEQFRNAIWGFYGQGSGDALWSGAFSAPLPAPLGTWQAYGAYLLNSDGADAGRSPGLTYVCEPGSEVQSPAPGRVVYANRLELTGGTVVIDHGCGVKSYLFGLEGLAELPLGSGVTQGEALGTATDRLTWEVRIGIKSIAPLALTKRAGGLFWAPGMG